MRYNLNSLLELLDTEDLHKIRTDLENGGIQLRRLLDNKIKQREKFCVVVEEVIECKS